MTGAICPPPELGVTKYVAEVHGDRSSFRVFQTGRAGIYLFAQIDPSGCDTCLHLPIRAADLRPDLRRALRHGWGLTTAGGAARLAHERAQLAAHLAREADAR